MIARRALVIAIAATTTGCTRPAHVTLDMTTPGTCGRPTGITALNVIAYSASREDTRTLQPSGAADLADFPTDTQQLGVKVLGDMGLLVAEGKTAPVDFANLRDGATLPVFMAPPDGFCATNPMSVARVNPLVARAGDGVLVVGGTDGGGAQLASAELYDPAVAAFAPVDVSGLAAGFAGCTLTELGDGTVALSGIDNVLAVFDPATRQFAVTTIFAARHFHGAIAIGPQDLLLAAGCTDVACMTANDNSDEYLYAKKPNATTRPHLAAGALRIAPSIVDVGVEEADGVRRFVLAGGSGDPGAGDRFALDDTATTPVAGFGAQVVAIDGGAVLSAFDPDGGPPLGTARVLAPGTTLQALIHDAPLVRRARVVALEDGSVLAIGGELAGAVARYDPTADAWTQRPPNAAGDDPGTLDAPTLVRMTDGSVLVLGGATASAQAWIYRPSLVGPWQESVTALPFGTPGTGFLVAPDPAAVCRAPACATPSVVLQAAGADLGARMLVGGPRMATGSIGARVRVCPVQVPCTGAPSGVALIARQVAPGRALVAELVAGMPAVVAQLDGGQRTTLCTGATVGAFDPSNGNQIGLDVHGGRASVTLDGTPLASCGIGLRPEANDRGQWGIAADGVGANVELVTVNTSR